MDRFTPEEAAALERRKRASLGQVLLRAARLLDEAAGARVRSRGGAPLRRAHTALLPHIGLAGTRLTELAARAGVTKQAVGPLVEELEGMGLLRRVPDPGDGRAKRVCFTRKGFRALFEGLGVLAELEEELERELGARRIALLREGLTRLADALTPAPPGRGKG